METKAAKEKYLNTHLQYLKGKPLIGQTSSDLASEWMQMVLNDPDTVDPNTLPLKNTKDLPTGKNVLVLYYFFPQY